MVAETQPIVRTIVHYEIPATDPDKLVAFYNGVFGWTFRGAPGMEDYKMADTGEGAADVAVFKKMDAGDPGPRNYVAVESVNEFAAKLEQHGGTIAHRFTVPHMGYGAIAFDPEGNQIGLWEADCNAQE